MCKEDFGIAISEGLLIQVAPAPTLLLSMFAQQRHWVAALPLVKDKVASDDWEVLFRLSPATVARTFPISMELNQHPVRSKTCWRVPGQVTMWLCRAVVWDHGWHDRPELLQMTPQASRVG